MDKQIMVAKKKYILGFVSSLVLTGGAFLIAQLRISSENDFLSHEAVVLIILSLAIVQMIVQLVFFLHIGEEIKPRWKLLSLLFGIMVVAIIFIGSLWIMYNLDYNMMSDHQSLEGKIIKDELIRTSE